MNLNQITIPVLNVEKSIKFYKTLGLRLIVNSTDRYARFECKEGDSTFSLHKVDDLPIGTGIFVYFEVNDLDFTYLELVKKGIQFLSEPKNQSWLWKEARLKDPDGNTIIIYNAGNNRKNPPWRIES